MSIERHDSSRDQQNYQAAYAASLEKVFRVYEEAEVAAHLVGSGGRLAVLGEELSHNSKIPQDIDIVVIEDQNTTHEKLQKVKEKAVEAAAPIRLEQHLDGQIKRQEKHVAISYREIKREVDPQVFETYTGTVYGAEVPTFHPKTLIHLPTLFHGYLRPEDIQKLHQFRHKIRGFWGKFDKHPHKLYQQFHELKDERMERYKVEKFWMNARALYQTKVPENVREKLSFLSKPIWFAIKGNKRNE